MVSVTVTTTAKDPAVSGVPEITPVALLIDIPPGSPLADHVYVPAPPDAVTVVLG